MTHSYTTVVLGGTPGGIAAAVSAARQGTETLLITYNEHLGGMMTGGLSYTDTLMKKDRTPIFEEWRAAVRDHYESEYGTSSESYAACEDGYIAEPHIGEEILDSIVDETERLDVLWGYYPTAVDRTEGRINAVTLQSFGEGQEQTVTANVFIEATYEGDLMATAGVSYRLGRESRNEYGEQFAGQLYTRTRGDRYYPQEAVGEGVDPSAPADRRGPLDTPAEKNQGKLDLVPHPAGISEIHPKSTGEGDGKIQAYNYRLCLTNDPKRRRLPTKPDGYDSSEYQEVLEEVKRAGFRSTLRLRYLPNNKADMNTADLPGENYDYPEADWKRRTEIADRHRSHALGLLFFLQNDSSVPDDVQDQAREWGLATDEWEDNDNFPFQLYVREARRLDGQYTFTENDARHAHGIDRTPIHHDSIAVVEYPLDSHACTDDRQTGSHPEGHFYASQVTRPAHVPYRTLLPESIDNLIVPVPLSASHIGYGSIRLEPTWLHIGESAGHAAALAEESDIPPAEIDVDRLQHRLAHHGVMLSFFNDTNVTDDEPWAVPLQYLATKGYFSSYDAQPTSPLSRAVSHRWARLTTSLLTDDVDDPTGRARELVGTPDSEPISGHEFVELLEEELSRSEISAVDARAVADGYDTHGEDAIRRGTACSIIYEILS